MWMRHLFSFIGTVLHVFFDGIGTTWLGWIINFIFAAPILVALWSMLRERGPRAAWEHLHQAYRKDLRTALRLALLVYCPVLIWSLGRAVYLDHEYFVGLVRNAQVGRVEYIRKADKCAADLETKGALLEAKDSLVTSLQNALTSTVGPREQQDANLSSCINTIAKMNPEVHRQVRAIAFQFLSLNLRTHQLAPPSPDPDNVFDSVIVIATNQIEQKAAGILECPVDFQIESQPVLTSMDGHGFVGNSSPAKLSEKKYFLYFPPAVSWGPTTPMFVRVRTEKEQMRDCTFTPQ